MFKMCRIWANSLAYGNFQHFKCWEFWEGCISPSTFRIHASMLFSCWYFLESSCHTQCWRFGTIMRPQTPPSKIGIWFDSIEFSIARVPIYFNAFVRVVICMWLTFAIHSFCDILLKSITLPKYRCIRKKNRNIAYFLTSSRINLTLQGSLEILGLFWVIA